MITVLGHLNPDTDSTCSALAYAWFLNQQGKEAEAAVAGTPGKETLFILERFELTLPNVLSELNADHTLALVDTNNPEELVTGWEKSKLISIIDHHKLVGSLSTPEPITVIIEPVACTATIILGLMDQANITPPHGIAGIMLTAILSDTLKFTSPTTTDTDREAARRLATIADQKIDELAEAMFAAKSDLTGMSTEDILMIDSKIFSLGNEKLRISVLESTAPAGALAKRAEFEAALATMKETEGLTGALFFIIDILHSNAELIVPSQSEKELASKAFGVPFTEATLHLPGVVSRKKQVVPQLEAALS